MLPNGTELLNELEFISYGNMTYDMKIEENKIIGVTNDDLESVKQMIYKILNTERYENIIYSWNFGIELHDLFGEPIDWVCSELTERIKDALSVDDRITDVGEFEFDLSTRNVVVCTFLVSTIYGTISENVEVRI